MLFCGSLSRSIVRVVWVKIVGIGLDGKKEKARVSPVRNSPSNATDANI